MTDDQIKKLHDVAHGEALFASMLAMHLFMRLERVAPTGQEMEQIDFVTLQLERRMADRPEHRGAIEQARVRLEEFREFYAKLPATPSRTRP